MKCNANPVNKFPKRGNPATSSRASSSYISCPLVRHAAVWPGQSYVSWSWPQAKNLAGLFQALGRQPMADGSPVGVSRREKRLSIDSVGLLVLPVFFFFFFFFSPFFPLPVRPPSFLSLPLFPIRHLSGTATRHVCT